VLRKLLGGVVAGFAKYLGRIRADAEGSIGQTYGEDEGDSAADCTALELDNALWI
jgi:hypothetical protein